MSRRLTCGFAFDDGQSTVCRALDQALTDRWWAWLFARSAHLVTDRAPAVDDQ